MIKKSEPVTDAFFLKKIVIEFIIKIDYFERTP